MPRGKEIKIRLSRAKIEAIEMLVDEGWVTRQQFFDNAISEELTKYLERVKKERRKSIPLAGLDNVNDKIIICKD